MREKWGSHTPLKKSVLAAGRMLKASLTPHPCLGPQAQVHPPLSPPDYDIDSPPALGAQHFEISIPIWTFAASGLGASPGSLPLLIPHTSAPLLSKSPVFLLM